MDQNLATAGTPTMEEIVENIRNEEESEDNIIEIHIFSFGKSRTSITRHPRGVGLWRDRAGMVTNALIAILLIFVSYNVLSEGGSSSAKAVRASYHPDEVIISYRCFQEAVWYRLWLAPHVGVQVKTNRGKYYMLENDGKGFQVSEYRDATNGRFFATWISNRNGSSINFPNDIPISAPANVSQKCLNFPSAPVSDQLNSTLKSNIDKQFNTTKDETATIFFVQRASDGVFFKQKSSSGASHIFSDEYIFSPTRSYDFNRTIFVGGMSKFTTVQSFYKHFLSFGTITGCSLARNKLTGASKDFGFVEFETIEQAKRASDFYPHVIDDQEAGVRFGYHNELRQKFKLFVGGLSKETSVETLREYFSKFGDIIEFAILRNNNNSSRGYGFVIFKSQKSINNVLNSAPHYIDKKAVTVEHTPVRQREFTIIVRKLSPNTTNESLREYYSRFGELTQCNVKFDRQTGQSRGFGYVAFSSQKELDSVSDVNPHIIDDVKVELEYVTNEFDMIVTSLTPNITEKALNEYFSRYGKLRRCEIKETSPGARTGFVSFWSEEEVLKALADRPHIINGKRVHSFQKDHDFTVFVGNLPSDATDDSLFATFSKYGKLVHCEVKQDRNTNRSLGYGFVSFEKAEQGCVFSHRKNKPGLDLAQQTWTGPGPTNLDWTWPNKPGLDLAEEPWTVPQNS
ncbi:RNA recognition motif domain-containing protein [Ditylenchus destructor]|nr:RNA recognition motif domain-containing protein [Ditylenchus destructor]